MKKTDWKRKLASRKLWMSVASFTSMLLIYFGKAETQAEQVATLIMSGASVIAYIIGEGLADSSTTYEVTNSVLSSGEDETKE